MRIDPSNSSLHGQLTNEIQNGVSISRTYDALGFLGWGDFNAEAQSRRGFECQQFTAGSGLVADKATMWEYNSPFSILHSTFVWDGWNIIREIQWPVASDQWSVETLATSHSPLATDYVWGLDLDGTLQGAGGVGGLLAVVRSDCAATNSSFVIRHSSLYLPAYDANGNVSEYVTTNGSIVAHYDYSPFGETLIESGDLASTFTHRFSTKPWCPVTGLYEYQMRKYRPEIGRWLSRDSVCEIEMLKDDGDFSIEQNEYILGSLEPLYAFISNQTVLDYDYLGNREAGSRARWFVQRIEPPRNDNPGAMGFIPLMEDAMYFIFNADAVLEKGAKKCGHDSPQSDVRCKCCVIFYDYSRTDNGEQFLFKDAQLFKDTCEKVRNRGFLLDPRVARSLRMEYVPW